MADVPPARLEKTALLATAFGSSLLTSEASTTAISLPTVGKFSNTFPFVLLRAQPSSCVSRFLASPAEWTGKDLSEACCPQSPRTNKWATFHPEPLILPNSSTS